MRSTMTTNALEPSSKSDLGLADPNEDIRERKVYDRDGTQFGKVDDVFIDARERRARLITVRSGDILGIGGKRYLVPVDAITVNGERVTRGLDGRSNDGGPAARERFDRRGPAERRCDDRGRDGGRRLDGDRRRIARRRLGVRALRRTGAVLEPDLPAAELGLSLIPIPQARPRAGPARGHLLPHAPVRD